MTRYFRKRRSLWTRRKIGSEIRPTARPARNIFSKLVFHRPAEGRGGEKKGTISSLGEGSSRVLIIQHTPNKWASFLEAPLALGSRMLSALVAHLTISSRPYGESFCHESKSLAASCCDLRGYASRTEAIVFFFK